MIEKIELKDDSGFPLIDSFAFKSNEAVYYVPSLKAEFRPLASELKDPKEFGLNTWDMNEILCATRLKSCLRNRTNMLTMYELRRVPNPMLEVGLDFYYGNAEELEDLGKARLVSYSELAFSIAPNVLPNELNDQNVKTISWIDLTDEIHLEFNFLPRNLKNAFCKPLDVLGETKFKCKIIADIGVPALSAEQWLRQELQGWVRNAHAATATLYIKPKKEFKKLILADEAEHYSLVVPVVAMNFWQIERGHYGPRGF